MCCSSQMDSLQLATSYEEFDTHAYYKTYRSPLTSDGSVQQYLKFILDSLHDVFSTGLISGDRLLDVGTGASLLSFLSASRHVEEIHLSDLLQTNRDMLQSWLEGEDRENDIVQYVIGKENEGTSTTERLRDLRRRVTQIKFIDVNKHLLVQEQGLDGKYDIVTSAFCLEVATRSAFEFKMVVDNVGKVVKDGGHLILVGTLEEKFYIVGNVKFWNACITEADVKYTLKVVGFEILWWKTFPKIKERCDVNNKCDFAGFFVVVARK